MLPKFLLSQPGHLHDLTSVKNLMMFNLVGGFIGIVTHFIFLFFFALANVPELVYINIFSVLLWCWALYESQHAHITRAALIAIFEVCAHTLIATYYVGSGVGFHLYLWALIAWMVLNTAFKIGHILVLSLVVSIITYICRADILPAQKYTLSPAMFDIAVTFNTIAAILCLLITTALIRVYMSQQKQELSNLAVRDPLTNLYNRLYLSSFLAQYKEKAKRAHEEFCVVMGDVDHFKRINDKYGHEKGDEILVKLADYIQSELRVQDLVVRWGGEEFLIVLVNCSLAQANERINLIRHGINTSLNFISKDGAKSLSMSFGVARVNHSEPIEDLIARADKLMYRAKKAGRNCVVSED
jgi:diguanylate cyclase (GGDEF)-like protein